MTSARWSRIETLFNSLAPLSDPERRIALDDALQGGEQMEIVSEVKRLLVNLESCRSYLSRSPEGVSMIRDALVGSSWDGWPLGTLLAGRFRIEERIGSGGMGEVYAARDERLQLRVALKCLPAVWWSDGEFQERLRREIMFARKITHPNVCRIYDLSEHHTPDGVIPFLTMELLEGETLAKRLRICGTLKPEELEPLALQLFDGLSAAHRAGVIHRDLKPSNLMIASDQDGERLVILDFGIALHAALPEQTLTESGAMVGTLSYMAPEQLLGDCDQQSDIFAAGLILYEALVGEPAFGPRGSLASVVRRLTQRADPPRRHHSKFPSRWLSLLDGCLEGERSQRVKSAEQAKSMLVDSRPVRRFPRGNRRLITWAVACSVLLSLCFGYYRYMRLRGTALVPGTLCMIVPLQNASGDSTLNTLPLLLREQLQQSRHLEVWDTQRLPEILVKMRHDPALLDGATWREVARRDGVSLIVFNSLSQLGGEYMWNLRAERVGKNPSDASASWEQTYRSYSRTGLAELTREAANWIRTTGGELRESIVATDHPSRDFTSSSWEALQLFDQAEETGKSKEDAILLLKEAVRLDPQFALALMRLGDHLTSLRRLDEGLLYWHLALQESNRHRLTLKEQLHLQSFYAMEIWDFAAAEAATTRWMQEFPQDGLAYYVLSSALLCQGRAGDAQKILARMPTKSRFATLRFGALAQISLETGNADELANLARKLTEAGRRESGDRYEGLSYLLHGDSTAAEATFRRMTESSLSSERSRGFVLLANLFAERDKPIEAKKALQAGSYNDAESGQQAYRAEKLVGLAFLEWRFRRLREARAWALEAARIEPGPTVLVQVVTVVARSGFLADAERLASNFHSPVEGPRFDCARRRMRGEILLARGRVREGLAELERASRSDMAVLPKEYLANALQMAGETERFNRLAEAFRNQPGLAWIYPEQQFPGIRSSFVPHSHKETKNGSSSNTGSGRFAIAASGHEWS